MPPAKQGVFGTITAKTTGVITVQTKLGTSVDLAFRSDTKFHVPGKAQASLDDFAVGARVAALVEGQAGSQAAVKVMAVPAEPQREHRVLTVVDISGKTLIAEDAQGNRVEVALDREVSADLKGQLVTFIGARSAQSDRFKANVEVKIDQIVKRLEAHLKTVEAQGKAEIDVQAKAKNERDLADLKARLEANMQRHLDIMAEVIAKAPPQAKARLEAARQASLKGYMIALEVMGQGSAELRVQTVAVVRGTIQSVDAAAGQVVVALPNGATLTLKLTTNTRITVNGRPATAADLKVNMRVRVQYDLKTLEAFRVDAYAAVTGGPQNPPPGQQPPPPPPPAASASVQTGVAVNAGTGTAGISGNVSSAVTTNTSAQPGPGTTATAGASTAATAGAATSPPSTSAQAGTGVTATAGVAGTGGASASGSAGVSASVGIGGNR